MSEPEFRFVAGQLALDFVNTVDWRGPGRAAGSERLASPAAWRRWLRAAGLGAGGGTGTAAGERPAGPRAVEAIHRVRALLHRVFFALGRGRAIAVADRTALARLADRALARRELRVGARSAGWHWRRQAADPGAGLDPVVWDAAQLLVGADRARVRVCDGPGCGWVFVDRSRNGRRRWCAMDLCGGRAKARAYYARVKGRRRSP